MTEPLTIGAFVVAVTQLLKDLGIIAGNTTKIAAILIGAAATYTMVYMPELWSGISEFLIGLTATGLISFANEYKDR
jgi:hypothetical protein